MAFDDRHVKVSPVPKRIVSFEVDEKEAERIAGWLEDALALNMNTPYASDPIRRIRAGFKAVADGREFGGH